MQGSPSQVNGVRLRTLSRRRSWVRIPPTAPRSKTRRGGVVELRDGKIVISKPKVEGNYADYYSIISSPKIKKVYLKKLFMDEASNRIGPTLISTPSFQLILRLVPLIRS